MEPEAAGKVIGEKRKEKQWIRPVKVKQISEELGVKYVLEGSVQKTGNRLRINAQLIDALKLKTTLKHDCSTNKKRRCECRQYKRPFLWQKDCLSP
jgi:hypothetical protein